MLKTYIDVGIAISEFLTALSKIERHEICISLLAISRLEDFATLCENKTLIPEETN